MEKVIMLMGLNHDHYEIYTPEQERHYGVLAIEMLLGD